MSQICQDKPLSWLTLEMYHLKELPSDESLQVQAHLDSCPSCRSCLEQIEVEQDFALPPLSLESSLKQSSPVRWWTQWNQLFLGSGFAIAAVALLVFLLPTSPQQKQVFPPSRIATKGGDVAISLVRKRKGRTLHNPTTFRPKDRFKVLVTCPPPKFYYVEVVVIQGDRRFFPLPSGEPSLCGNRIPLPGAFHLTGKKPTTICAVLSPQILARKVFAKKRMLLWPGLTVCTEVIRSR